nr:MAG TPA: hypothetical protein [Caudoviricetes sp.]
MCCLLAVSILFHITILSRITIIILPTFYHFSIKRLPFS